MTTATQRYFDRHARAYDRRWARPTLAERLLRPGPQRGQELAALVVSAHPGARVLDVGCGPGRVGETALDAGASSYVGVDLSPHMLALAGERLGRFPRVELVEGDFLAVDVPGVFEVVLALGLFDYVAEPERAAHWLHARCAGTLVASFTQWDRLKAPVRHARYRLLHGCRVFDYTVPGVTTLLAGAGFTSVELPWQGRRGFLVTASGR
jgi:SAM-dependent methyltransferase